MRIESCPTASPKQRAKCPSERIRVLIGDSTEIGCELLKNALSRDRRLDVVALGTTMQEVITATAAANAETVIVTKALVDADPAGRTSLRTLASSRTESIPVIVLLPDGDQNDVIEVFRAGARGVFRLSASLPSLTKCIHAVHNGQVWASSADLTMIMRAFSSIPSFRCIAPNGKELLTNREQQVAELIAQGLTNREIADSLHLREHTIKNYLFKIYDKVGVSTRVELIVYVLSHSAAA